ncbi:hypothetical protein RYX36_011205, partial [Vicia faba]
IQRLEHLFVYNNSLTGELPVEMTELKNLKNISLFNNMFSGVIPQSMGINNSLVQLDFVNNRFTGNLPPNLCFGRNMECSEYGNQSASRKNTSGCWKMHNSKKGPS